MERIPSRFILSRCRTPTISWSSICPRTGCSSRPTTLARATARCGPDRASTNSFRQSTSSASTSRRSSASTATRRRFKPRARLSRNRSPAMAETKIGFLSGGEQSMPHYASSTPLVPQNVRIDHEGLGLYGASLYEISNKKETIVRCVKELAAEHGWHGVIVTAAPTEVLNPGLYDALKAALAIPFTTALHACV